MNLDVSRKEWGEVSIITAKILTFSEIDLVQIEGGGSTSLVTEMTGR